MKSLVYLDQRNNEESSRLYKYERRPIKDDRLFDITCTAASPQSFASCCRSRNDFVTV